MATPTSGAVDIGIAETFEFVFFEGLGGVSEDVPFPFPVSLAGRPFAIDLRHYQWGIPDMVRSAVDFSASPGEQSFDTGGVWLRSNGDWSLGAGQEYHDAQGSEQRMFHASRGLDIWTHRQIKLLPKMEQLLASTHSTLKMLPVGGFLYFMDGEGKTLQRTATPQDPAPVFSSIAGLPGSNLIALTTDGNLVYIATASNGIYKHDPIAGVTAAAYGGAASSTNANVIGYAAGFLLCGVGNVLSSIAADGTLTTVKTHRVATFQWSAIVGAPNGIYAGGQANNDVTEIFHVGFDPTSGGLAVPIHAGELPRGEYLRSLSYYGSVILLGTSEGVRIANTNSDNSLEIGALIKTETDVLATFGFDKFVYFGWTNYDALHTGVGRANLAEFRAKVQPSYASDVMADDTQGVVSDVCIFKENVYFALSGSGWWRQIPDGTLVETGVMTLGKVEWGTFEAKTFLGLQMTTLPLIGQVSATLTDDAGAIESLGTLDRPGTTGLGDTLGAGLGGLSTFFEIELTLHRPAA